MTRKELNAYRSRLSEMLQRVDEGRNRLKHEALQPTGGEASGGSSNLPTHPSDLGSRAFEEEVTLGLLENEESLLEEINNALGRIDDGTFGVCESCARPIGGSRLEAAPYARECVDCARQSEAQARP